MTLAFLVLSVNRSKRIRVSQDKLFFGCLCLGRIHKSLKIDQETHGLWDFQIKDSWIITKNLSLLRNVFDLRLVVCLRRINAFASKFCSTHFLFCSAHFLLFHAILDQGFSLWARGTGKEGLTALKARERIGWKPSVFPLLRELWCHLLSGVCVWEELLALLLLLFQYLHSFTFANAVLTAVN